MPLPYPTLIPGLRSPSDQIRGMVYFGRMLDKIRLAEIGLSPGTVQTMFEFIDLDEGRLHLRTA